MLVGAIKVWSVSRQRHRLVLFLTMMMNVAFKCEWLVESRSFVLD